MVFGLAHADLLGGKELAEIDLAAAITDLEGLIRSLEVVLPTVATAKPEE